MNPMLQVDERDLAAVAKVIRSGKLFRYHEGGECTRFEARFAEHLGVRHLQLCTSGTTAIGAALAAVGIGPGDEVIVPAHTYMATAIGVLNAGAIPVIVDIDESITMDPQALEAAIGPRTRGVIPVHMWGVVCDLGRIMRVARRHRLIVVEDCCQCVGGAYRGRMVGSFGMAGCFSYNYFKNITCGEGGAIATSDPTVHERLRCLTDCCGFYWTGRPTGIKPFVANSGRLSELDGAMLNVQLDRLPGLLARLRRYKQRVLKQTAGCGVTASPVHSPDGECATCVMYLLPTAAQAERFAKTVGGGIAGKTGRHTYNEWDPILARRGHLNPKLDPFRLPANRGCRMKYGKNMLPRSLDILNRTVMIGLSPRQKPADIAQLIDRIKAAAAEVG
jgi:dTDP-4-amino-4,6-dideoxygalactose transaminase